ncbi:unnamed protein product [Phytophthora fragariaefolia]|uniref:Unnamed protein product n=1 Tax=Phytophthora fragariaefolia TaxID=1490495 RepID=A0A9W6XZP5_9STRA|nr:unnamed protein product [Phytophthora fragariaefolia]
MESSTSTHAEPPTSSAPHDGEATEDEYALNSDYEDSDPGSVEWYEEMRELLPPGGTAADSDSKYDSGDENAETATPPAGESLASSRAASPEASPRFQTSASDVPPSATARRAATAQKKQERERWKAIIDNWLELEGKDLTKLANDTKALKKMRKDGWGNRYVLYLLAISCILSTDTCLIILHVDTDHFPMHEEFPGLYDGAFGPTAEVLGFAESPLELFLFFLPRKLWLKVKKRVQPVLQTGAARSDGAKFRAQTGDNQLTLEQILANEMRLHKKIEAHEISSSSAASERGYCVE